MDCLIRRPAEHSTHLMVLRVEQPRKLDQAGTAPSSPARDGGHLATSHIVYNLELALAAFHKSVSD
jgi:hypothetical protein